MAAVVKLAATSTGDTLCDAARPVILDGISYPKPLFSAAVMPKSKGDLDKMGAALAQLHQEDPTLHISRDPVTGETIVSGLGESHVQVATERLARKSGVNVEVKLPRVPYRETIASTVRGVKYRHKKQTGGAGQFGEVFLRVEPLDGDSPNSTQNGGPGVEIVNEVFGGTIPGQFIPAVEKGIHDVMEAGAIAGYPMENIRVAITDGKHHPVDSKEVAFRTAGKYAFKDAVLKAKPALLEPVVNMEVTVPEANVGTITGDLSGKRGRIQGTDILPGGMAVVKAQAPLAEVMQYQSQLKSVTGGQGSFAMELSHYDPVPPQVQQQIASQYKPKAEEE